MKHARRYEPDAHDFAELDRLVLAELEGLEQVEAPRATSRRPPRQQTAPGTRPPGATRPPEPPPLSAAEVPPDPFGTDVEAFIERSVEWLRSRPERDEVVAAIWTRILDVDGAGAPASSSGGAADGEEGSHPAATEWTAAETNGTLS